MSGERIQIDGEWYDVVLIGDNRQNSFWKSIKVGLGLQEDSMFGCEDEDVDLNTVARRLGIEIVVYDIYGYVIEKVESLAEKVWLLYYNEHYSLIDHQISDPEPCLQRVGWDELIELDHSTQEEWFKAFFAKNNEKAVTAAVFKQIMDPILCRRAKDKKPYVVVDLGCGDGTLSRKIAEILLSCNLMVQYRAMDHYQELVNQANAKFQGINHSIIHGNCFDSRKLDELYGGKTPDLVLISHSGYYTKTTEGLNEWLNQLLDGRRFGRETVLFMVHADPLSTHSDILARYKSRERSSSDINKKVLKDVRDFTEAEGGRNISRLEVLFNSFIFFSKASDEEQLRLYNFILDAQVGTLDEGLREQFLEEMKEIRHRQLQDMTMWALSQIVMHDENPYLDDLRTQVGLFVDEYRDDGGLSPIHWAALEGNMGILRQLVRPTMSTSEEEIERRVNVVAHNVITPLSMAAIGNCACEKTFKRNFIEVKEFLDDCGVTEQNIASAGMFVSVLLGGDVSLEDEFVMSLINLTREVFVRLFFTGDESLLSSPLPLLNIRFLRWFKEKIPSVFARFEPAIVRQAMKKGDVKVLEWVLECEPQEMVSYLIRSEEKEEKGWLSSLAFKKSDHLAELKMLLNWIIRAQQFKLLRSRPLYDRLISTEVVDVDRILKESSIYLGYLLGQGNSESICEDHVRIKGAKCNVRSFRSEGKNSFFNVLDCGLGSIGRTDDLIGIEEIRRRILRSVNSRLGVVYHKKKLTKYEQDFLNCYEKLFCVVRGEEEEVDEVISSLLWVIGNEMGIKFEIYYPNGEEVPLDVKFDIDKQRGDERLGGASFFHKILRRQNQKDNVIKLRYMGLEHYDLILSEKSKRLGRIIQIGDAEHEVFSFEFCLDKKYNFYAAMDKAFLVMGQRNEIGKRETGKQFVEVITQKQALLQRMASEGVGLEEFDQVINLIITEESLANILSVLDAPAEYLINVIGRVFGIKIVVYYPDGEVIESFLVREPRYVIMLRYNGRSYDLIFPETTQNIWVNGEQRKIKLIQENEVGRFNAICEAVCGSDSCSVVTEQEYLSWSKLLINELVNIYKMSLQGAVLADHDVRYIEMFRKNVDSILQIGGSVDCARVNFQMITNVFGVGVRMYTQDGKVFAETGSDIEGDRIGLLFNSAANFLLRSGYTVLLPGADVGEEPAEGMYSFFEAIEKGLAWLGYEYKVGDIKLRIAELVLEQQDKIIEEGVLKPFDELFVRVFHSGFESFLEMMKDSDRDIVLNIIANSLNKKITLYELGNGERVCFGEACTGGNIDLRYEGGAYDLILPPTVVSYSADACSVESERAYNHCLFKNIVIVLNTIWQTDQVNLDNVVSLVAGWLEEKRLYLGIEIERDGRRITDFEQRLWKWKNNLRDVPLTCICTFKPTTVFEDNSLLQIVPPAVMCSWSETFYCLKQKSVGMGEVVLQVISDRLKVRFEIYRSNGLLLREFDGYEERGVVKLRYRDFGYYELLDLNIPVLKREIEEINVIREYGSDIMHTVVQVGEVGLVRDLAVRGVSVVALDREGMSPMDYARRLGNEEIVGVLCEYGAVLCEEEVIIHEHPLLYSSGGRQLYLKIREINQKLAKQLLELAEEEEMASIYLNLSRTEQGFEQLLELLGIDRLSEESTSGDGAAPGPDPESEDLEVLLQMIGVSEDIERSQIVSEEDDERSSISCQELACRSVDTNRTATVGCVLVQPFTLLHNFPQITSLCRQAIAIGGMSLANLVQELGASDHGSGWDVILTAVEKEGALHVLYTLKGIDVINQTFAITTQAGEHKLLEALVDRSTGRVLDGEIKDDPSVLYLPSVDPLRGHFIALMKEINKATVDQAGYFMQKVGELIHQAVEHIAPEEQTDQQATIMDLLTEMFEHLGTQQVPFYPGYPGKKPSWPDDFGDWGSGDADKSNEEFDVLAGNDTARNKDTLWFGDVM